MPSSNESVNGGATYAEIVEFIGIPLVLRFDKRVFALGVAVGAKKLGMEMLPVALYVIFDDTVLFKRSALVAFGSYSGNRVLL